MRNTTLPNELKSKQSEITLTREELKRVQERLEWSEKLAKENNVKINYIAHGKKMTDFSHDEISEQRKKMLRQYNFIRKYLLIVPTGDGTYHDFDDDTRNFDVCIIYYNDDKEGKPENIQRIIGRKPVLAVGNSDGDLAMLQYTASNKNFLNIYIHHTDAEREWAYDRESHIGQLDKGLEQAAAENWTVVNMKEDWKVVYPFELNK